MKTSNRIFTGTLLLIGVFLLTSCSKEKQLERRLEGTWDIKHLTLTPASQDGISVDQENVGTITFDDDGTGKNNYTYSYEFDGEEIAVNDSESFRWENTENTVSITGNANSGEKTIVWDVDNNSRKEQVWTRTDIYGNMWELEMEQQ